MKFGQIVSFKHNKKGKRTILFLEERDDRILGIALPEDEDTRNEIVSMVNKQMLTEFANDKEMINMALEREESIKRRREAVEILTNGKYNRPNKKEVAKLMNKLIVSYERSEIDV